MVGPWEVSRDEEGAFLKISKFHKKGPGKGAFFLHHVGTQQEGILLHPTLKNHLSLVILVLGFLTSRITQFNIIWLQ